jgi:predicted hotdog family 3-hydroxylacyl-ACP dehydratase
MPELLKADIARLVPHAGTMVLLDELISHDDQAIHCRAELVLDDQHPLVRKGRLPATALAEYGAQAMAVHGGLLAEPGSPPRPGRLVALGQLDLALDALARPVTLEVHARCLGGDRAGQIYEFEVLAGEQWLARGRATIMFAD